MPKKHIKQIAQENDLRIEEAIQYAHEKLPKEQVTGKGNNLWVGEDGQKILHAAAFAPEIVPKYYQGKVVRNAPNPSYVYAHVRELDKVIPVVLPRYGKSNLLHKNITIEEIKDDTGSTYRYVKSSLHK